MFSVTFLVEKVFMILSTPVEIEGLTPEVLIPALLLEIGRRP